MLLWLATLLSWKAMEVSIEACEFNFRINSKGLDRTHFQSTKHAKSSEQESLSSSELMLIGTR